MTTRPDDLKQFSHKFNDEIKKYGYVDQNLLSKELDSKKEYSVYRVHQEPDIEKIKSFDKIFEKYNLQLSKKQNIAAQDFNKILEIKTSFSDTLIKNLILRSQSQASYKETNKGHFGLGLTHYTHFTSPIRRYSDLLVHRQLIEIMNQSEEEKNVDKVKEIVKYISFTERRSVTAERETYDRYIGKLLNKDKGKIFKSYINGLNTFGLFITLQKYGGDGFIPLKYLPKDYYDVFDNNTILSGRNNGLNIKIGEIINAILIEANPLNGRLILKYSGKD